jgi:hypothetical protein
VPLPESLLFDIYLLLAFKVSLLLLWGHLVLFPSATTSRRFLEKMGEKLEKQERTVA